MNRRIATGIIVALLMAALSACVEKQVGSATVKQDTGTAARQAAAAEVGGNRKPNDPVIDLNSKAVIAATILQMVHRTPAKAPVTWDKNGDFKAAFESFAYEGFAVASVDVFDQQQAPDGKVTVQALVRMQHRRGPRAANAIQAVYSFARDGKPVIHKTMAGPIPSRDPEIEVLAVPVDKVAREKVFREKNYPGWLAAARRLATPLPAKDKARVYVFAFAIDRVLAKADLKIESNGKRSGKAVCLDDFGFAACMVGGEIVGQKNKAVFFLNNQKAAEAIIK